MSSLINLLYIAMIGAGFLTEWLPPLQTSFLVGVTYIVFALAFMLVFRSVNFRTSIRKLKGLDIK